LAISLLVAIAIER